MPAQKITPERPFGRPIKYLNVKYEPRQCFIPTASVVAMVDLGLDLEEIEVQARGLGKRAQKVARQYAHQRLMAEKPAAHMRLRQVGEYTAAAGSPDERRFKSEWERRLAAALDRLGIKWLYEPDQLTYRTWNGTLHAYIPDFRLPQFNDTYIEVKGPSGARPDDEDKMRRVLSTYRGLTLLLWDAMTIEYVEDCASADMVLPLLNTTRLAA